MERTEVDIADSLKNLKAKDRIKTSHVFFLLFFFLIIGFTAEFMYIKTLKRELDLLKTEVEKMRGAVNSTNSANENTNSHVRDLRKTLTNVTETLKSLKNETNTTKKRVDNAVHKTLDLSTEMFQLKRDVITTIENFTNEYDALFNESYYLAEALKIPKAVSALKNDMKIVNLKIDTTDDTISSLVKNISDVNAELDNSIEKNKIFRQVVRESAVALNESIQITKAEIRAMQEESSLRWITVTETIESLEHKIHQNEKNMNYLNVALVDWKTMEYAGLVNLTQGLESLKGEKSDVLNNSDKSTNVTSHPIQKSAESSNTNISMLQQITESKPTKRDGEPKVLKTGDGNSTQNEVKTSAIFNTSIYKVKGAIHRMPHSSLSSSTQRLENVSTSVKPPSKETIESKSPF